MCRGCCFVLSPFREWPCPARIGLRLSRNACCRIESATHTSHPLDDRRQTQSSLWLQADDAALDDFDLAVLVYLAVRDFLGEETPESVGVQLWTLHMRHRTGHIRCGADGGHVADNHLTVRGLIGCVLPVDRIPGTVVQHHGDVATEAGFS